MTFTRTCYLLGALGPPLGPQKNPVGLGCWALGIVSPRHLSPLQMGRGHVVANLHPVFSVIQRKVSPTRLPVPWILPAPTGPCGP